MSIKHKEVLIIDDDLDFRLLAKKILETAGLAVQDAESVDDAIKKATTRAPHLIITDLNMKPKNGFNFLEMRRNTPLLKNIPVIVMSALQDKKFILLAQAFNADDYIVKPIVASILLQKVRKALLSQTYKSYNFEKGHYPTVKLRITGTINYLSEAGLLFEAPVKISPETPTDIASPLLNEISQGTEFILKTSSMPGRLSGNRGQYFNNITFVGINEPIAQKIRKLTKSWN